MPSWTPCSPAALNRAFKENRDMRTMTFIDGENLVFRFQDMCKSGRKPNSSTKHISDVFVWHQHLRGEDKNPVRVNYYTSAVGTDEKLDDLRDKIGNTIVAGAGYGRRPCAHVFKKPKSSNKAKLVDISITIDALRHVYGNQVDTVFLFSGDGDFVPLVKEIMRNGKQVVIGAFSSGLSPEMKRIGDQFVDLDAWFFEPVK
jgi:uncharacterized LabA/DUF88 family protein